MKKKKLNIVWLKRDLRTFDHQPLFEAEKAKIDYIIVYLFEPRMINFSDSSLRHQKFIYHSILEINRSLKKYKRKVHIFKCDANVFFEHIISIYQINIIYSYRETGINITWDRDKKLKEILISKNIKWVEFANQGVSRGIVNRNNWDKNWFTYINSPLINNVFTVNNFDFDYKKFQFCIDNFSNYKSYNGYYQPAGELFAKKYLSSFINKRFINYNNHISIPEKSRYSCSRLSTYLSWGNLSMKYVYQSVKNSKNYILNKRPFDSFLARLKWRSHFIQKFEVDCSYEHTCINRGYEKLIYPNNDKYLEAWITARTGFPIIDACMNCLEKTGWLNFRMRAMLVSFLCHYLEQDWRRGVYHLSKLFLDYEPGIHFTQFQMQAGVTGVNSIRVYNPLKQSKEKDPDSIFIKKWVPELAKINNGFVHEPWKLTKIDLGGEKIPEHYINPIISPELKRTQTVKNLWEFRKEKYVKEESSRILKVHVRNRKL